MPLTCLQFKGFKALYNVFISAYICVYIYIHICIVFVFICYVILIILHYEIPYKAGYLYYL